MNYSRLATIHLVCPSWKSEFASWELEENWSYPFDCGETGIRRRSVKEAVSDSEVDRKHKESDYEPGQERRL